MKKQNPKEILIKELIKTDIKNQRVLSMLKRQIAKKFQIPFHSNVDLLKTYHRLVQNKRIKKSKIIEGLLRIRPIRSLSGIVNVSVLTKPHSCPGQCIFCPTEYGFPKSYLAGEPAADRAKTLDFDPYLQTQTRLKMLQAQGHPTDKIELRIVGGTWSYYPKQYQTYFIKRCFQAANEFKNSKLKAQSSKPQFKSQKLKTIQEINEKVKARIVGLSIETRPDFITEKEVLRLRKLSVTLVEMGIQTVYDDILKKCKTGLTVEKIAYVTKILKDAGFKLLYQVMPGLPGSNFKKDVEMFKILFEDERFKPDWIKIYPCLICKNTKLYQWWKKGQYKPYTEKELTQLLIEIKQILPYWTRLTRLFRDIPAQKILDGCKTSNLREIIQEEMRQKNLSCHCIRCREVKEKYNPKEKIYLFREDYDASEGKEIFLSFENERRSKLYSLLKLRIPSFILRSSKNEGGQTTFNHFIPVLQNAAIIREIQTFGPQLSISVGGRTSDLEKISPQHKGLGKKLIYEAEKITRKEFGLKKIAVIAGIGARQYYRKQGYKLKNTYMIKKL